jgi:hypothetical protein
MEYDIQTNWIRPSVELPSSGTRCLVTDGDVIVIATFVSQNTEHNVWLFTGLNEADSKNFDIQGWMQLPKPIKIIVHANQEKVNPTNGE